MNRGETEPPPLLQNAPPDVDIEIEVPIRVEVDTNVGPVHVVEVDPQMVDIGHRVLPDIPLSAPGIDLNESDGFSFIGRVGAWNSLLVEFAMLDKIPEQHDVIWC